MKSIAIVFVALAAATAASAVSLDRPSARLHGVVPTDLGPGSAWNVRFTLLRGGQPLPGARPRFWIRGGGVSRSFASRGLGGGRYRTRVVFPIAATYRYGIVVEKFSLTLGTLVIQGARVNAPLGIVVGPDGAVYVADVQGTTVARIDPRTKRRSVAARGLEHPVYVAFDAAGRLLVSDESSRIFRFERAGSRTLVAGNGRRAHSGDGGPAAQASLGGPSGMEVDRDGNLILAEYDGWIRIVRPDGTIGTLAGNGTEGYSGDGGLATRSVLRHPHDVALLSDGAIVVADSHNAAVRRIDRDGRISTIAGGLGAPVGIAPMPGGAVVVADGNGPIVLVEAGGAKRTLATGTTPFGIASSPDGDVYFTELETRRVKRLDTATGKVTTLLP